MGDASDERPMIGIRDVLMWEFAKSAMDVAEAMVSTGRVSKYDSDVTIGTAFRECYERQEDPEIGGEAYVVMRLYVSYLVRFGGTRLSDSHMHLVGFCGYECPFFGPIN